MKWLMPILIALPLLCQGQGNFVPNGSFEDISQCPWAISQITLATPWINDVGGCDLYNSCNLGTPSGNPHMGVPENLVGFQNAHSGEGYVGIFTYGGEHESDGREYIQVPLSQSLPTGTYIVSFWASLADEFQYAIGSLGAYLSDTLVVREQYNSVLEVEPSIQSPAGVIMSDKDIWYHITDTFTSRYGGEQYLLIGNFKTTAESDTLLVPTGSNNDFESYYYIDDVSVIALDTISGMERPEENPSFRLYPNPATTHLSIQSRTPLAHVRLLDLAGRSLRYTTPGRGGTQADRTVMDVSGLPSGIYFVEAITDDGRRAVQKVLVQ